LLWIEAGEDDICLQKNRTGDKLELMTAPAHRHAESEARRRGGASSRAGRIGKTHGARIARNPLKTLI
jgi:hypothetical protein